MCEPRVSERIQPRAKKPLHVSFLQKIYKSKNRKNFCLVFTRNKNHFRGQLKGQINCSVASYCIRHKKTSPFCSTTFKNVLIVNGLVYMGPNNWNITKFILSLFTFTYTVHTIDHLYLPKTQSYLY